MPLPGEGVDVGPDGWGDDAVGVGEAAGFTEAEGVADADRGDVADTDADRGDVADADRGDVTGCRLRHPSRRLEVEAPCALQAVLIGAAPTPAATPPAARTAVSKATDLGRRSRVHAPRRRDRSAGGTL